MLMRSQFIRPVRHVTSAKSLSVSHITLDAAFPDCNRRSYCCAREVTPSLSDTLTLSVLTSTEADTRGPVLKSQFSGRVLLPRYMPIKVDTHS